jgi:hypothetical protein
VSVLCAVPISQIVLLAHSVQVSAVPPAPRDTVFLEVAALRFVEMKLKQQGRPAMTETQRMAMGVVPHVRFKLVIFALFLISKVYAAMSTAA